jgi:glutathione S-transferase
MILLYHCISARSFRPLWTLEELGLPYTLHMLPFPPRALQRDYLQQNPLGTVPLLVDGPARMTESAAICQYLATRYGAAGPGALAVEPDDPDYAGWLNWLHFGEATLTFPQTLLLRYGRFEPADRRQPQVVEDYRRWFFARLKGIEAPLREQDYLCSRGFTVADISVSYALMLAAYLGLDVEFSPVVQAYWQHLKVRPAFLCALASQDVAAATQGVSNVPAPQGQD